MKHPVFLTNTAKINLEYIHPAVYPHVIVALLHMRRGESFQKGVPMVGPYETLFIKEKHSFSFIYTYRDNALFIMSIYMT